MVRVPQQEWALLSSRRTKYRKASTADLADFIENGGPTKKASHAFANRRRAADAAKLATYIKTLRR